MGRYHHINSLKMKEINTQIVLNAIRHAGQISRKDLAPLVGLTPATITNLVNKCIDQGAIIEAGSGESLGGRRPTILELNPRLGYVVGVELNVGRAICILSDFKAVLVDKTIADVDIGQGPDTVVKQICGMINSIIIKNSIDKNKVCGIGFVSAGPYDHQKGIMINPPNFHGWHNVPVKEMIERQTGITTYFERETPAAALAEDWYDRQKKHKRIFAANVYEVGLGGGLVVDGQIFRGFRDGGLEIGHMTVDIDGHPCSCGNNGCLEVLADGEAAIRYVKQMLDGGEQSAVQNSGTVMLKDVVTHAAAGDKVCIKAIEKCAFYLGTALSSLITVLSPDVIYLGGQFMDSSRLYFEMTVKKMSERTYPLHAREIEVKRSTFGPESGAMGGTAVVFQSLTQVV